MVCQKVKNKIAVTQKVKVNIRNMKPYPCSYFFHIRQQLNKNVWIVENQSVMMQRGHINIISQSSKVA